MNLICFSWPSVHSFPCSWFSLISIFFFNDFTYLSKLGALRYQLLGLAVKDQVAYQGQHSFHQLDVHCASFIFSQHSKVGQGAWFVCQASFDQAMMEVSLVVTKREEGRQMQKTKNKNPAH